MTRKDYKLIASAFADTKPRPDHPNFCEVRDERNYIIKVMAAKLRGDNSFFNKDVFIAACNA